MGHLENLHGKRQEWSETRLKFYVSVAASNVRQQARSVFTPVLGCHTPSEAEKRKVSASVRRNKLQPIEAVTVRYP